MVQRGETMRDAINFRASSVPKGKEELLALRENAAETSGLIERE